MNHIQKRKKTRQKKMFIITKYNLNTFVESNERSIANICILTSVDIVYEKKPGRTGQATKRRRSHRRDEEDVCVSVPREKKNERNENENERSFKKFLSFSFIIIIIFTTSASK